MALISVAETPGSPSKPVPKDRSDTSVTFTWNPPEEDGGSPVISYDLEVLEDTKWKPYAKDIVDCEFTIDNLDDEKTIKVRVAATNKVGRGKPSEPSDDFNVGEILPMLFNSGCIPLIS